MLRLTILFILTILVTGSSKGQTVSVKGKLLDSVSKKPIIHATVTVYKQVDSSIVAFQLSDSKGEFYFKQLPSNSNLKIIISCVGYKSLQKALRPNENKYIDLKNVLLDIDSKKLEDVFISTEVPPVIVKNNLIEFNASAFKTAPNSLIEDLLSKLPGIEIDKSGDIYFNGQKVNRITMDGKYFFGDNVKIATRNLSADIVEKIQVRIDTEQVDNGDQNSINSGNSINIVLKKEIKKQLFGRAYLGYGSEDRHEVGGMANIFRDKIQASLLTFSNNINKSGSSLREYQDLSNFNKNFFFNYLVEGRNGINAFQSKMYPYFNEGEGVSTSFINGLNLNFTPKKNTGFSFQYMHNDQKIFTQTEAISSQFLNDTLLLSSSSINKSTEAKSHKFDFGLSHRTSMNDVNIKTNYLEIVGVSNSHLDTRITRNDRKISSSQGNLKDGIAYKEFYEEIFFSQNFKSNKKRKFTASQKYWKVKGTQNSLSGFTNLYFFPLVGSGVYNQTQHQTSPNTTFSLLANYTEPITKKLSFKITTRLDVSKEDQNIYTYQRDFRNSYDSLVHNLSSSLNRNSSKYTNTAFFTYEQNQINFNLGVNSVAQRIRYLHSKTSEMRDQVSKISPYLRINWKQNSFYYTVDVLPPPIHNVVVVLDSTNPTNVFQGNPDLKSPIHHKLNLNFFKVDLKRHNTISFYGNAGRIDNDIIMTRYINSQGFQVIKPINSNESSFFNFNFAVTKEFKLIFGKTFSVSMNALINHSKRKLIVNSIIGYQKATGISPTIGFRCDLNNKFQLRADHTLRVNTIKYSNQFFKNNYFNQQTTEAVATFFVNKKIFVESSILYTTFDRSPNSPGISQTVVNSSLSGLFMKEKCQIKLTFFDLLNQNKNIFQFNNDNYFARINTTSLNQFVMLSMLYNFRFKVDKTTIIETNSRK